MEVHHDAGVVLGLVHDLLVIRLAQEGQRHAVCAERRLDDVGDVVLVLLLIEVVHVLTGELLVLAQVVVRAVGDAPELAPAEREQILKVGRGLGVEAQLLLLMVAQAEVLVLHTQTLEPLVAEAAPVVEPLEIGVRLAEELQLHLLKLADAEDEVARRDLVAEALADLADAERDLAARRALDVLEVDENALCGLGAQIHLGGRVLGHALVGLEHEVEFADIGKVALAAARAGDLLGADEGDHLVIGHGLNVHVGHGVLGQPALDELVGAVAHLAGLAVNERIIERRHMAGSHPDLRVHEDRGVEPDVVGVFLHELLPPCALDVVFQLHAERAVVPGVGEAAVDLRAGVHKAAVLAQGDDLVHCLFGIFHDFPPCSANGDGGSQMFSADGFGGTRPSADNTTGQISIIALKCLPCKD